MKDITVLKSVEGGEFVQVTMERVLFNALVESSLHNEAFTYLWSRKLLTEDLIEKMGLVSDKFNATFRKYGLDKYDVRAIYKTL